MKKLAWKEWHNLIKEWEDLKDFKDNTLNDLKHDDTNDTSK